jgi:hypothetical protein
MDMLHTVWSKNLQSALVSVQRVSFVEHVGCDLHRTLHHITQGQDAVYSVWVTYYIT